MSANGIGVVGLSSRSGWIGLLKLGERHSSPPPPPGLPWLAPYSDAMRPFGARLGGWATDTQSRPKLRLLRPAIWRGRPMY